MAPAFGTSASTAEATTVNTVIAAPASIADGDTLVIWHFIYNGAGAPATPTPPAGFVTAPGSWPLHRTNGSGDQADCHLWWKTAASESGNYTVTHSSAVCRGSMIRVTGADGTSPFVPNPTLNSGAGTTTTALSLTTTIDNELILFLAQDWHDTSNSLTAPTGTTPTFTARVNDAAGQFVATGSLSPAGATGNKTQTNNSLSADSWLAVLAAIQPPAAAASIPDLIMGPPRR